MNLLPCLVDSLQLLPLALDSYRRFLARAATPGLTAAMLLSGADTATAAQLYGATVAAAEPQDSTETEQPAGKAAAIGIRVSCTSAVESLLLPYFVEFCRRQYK